MIYDKQLDSIVHESKSQFIDKHNKQYAQQVLGSFLYYAHAIDMNISHALSTIASEQANPTERTLKLVQQLRQYMHTNSMTAICFHSSDMILNVHSNASYMSAGKGQSRAGGYLFPRKHATKW
jgi:hypothetical protein